MARIFAPFSAKRSNKCAPTKPVPPVTKIINANVAIYQFYKVTISFLDIFLKLVHFQIFKLSN